MSNRPILVTGASGGTQGQTGRRTAEMLLARGSRVRAFVHRIDERSERLRALGAEIVEGDLLDLASVRRAAAGVSTIYFAYPVKAGLLDAAAVMAFAAREAGVSRLVNLVMLRSTPDAPTPRMRQNFLSEQIFDWAGVGAIHVRATVFYENVRALVGTALAAQGVIRLPWGGDGTVLPLVAGDDVARVAAGLLTGDAAPADAAVPLIGEVLTVRDVVATYARVLGRPVRYEEISDDDWRRGALARGADAHAVEHLSHLWRALREGGGGERFEVTDAIEIWGGAKPRKFEDFVRA
jgi:uncharacterized protein YbjT (DUF2867 family)